MKRIIVAMLILFIPAFALAQETHWSVDEQTYLRSGHYAHLVDVFTSHKFANSPYGIWGFAGITPVWGECLAGPSYSMEEGNTYTTFGIGGGIEQTGFTPRFAVFMSSESDKASTLMFADFGEATGVWYMAYFVYQITPFLGLGVHVQQDVGIGPQVRLSKGPVYLWGGPMTENNEWGAVFGAGVRF